MIYTIEYSKDADKTLKKMEEIESATIQEGYTYSVRYHGTSPDRAWSPRAIGGRK